MELKIYRWFREDPAFAAFNRTAYGIEKYKLFHLQFFLLSFNRTAYGIEKTLRSCGPDQQCLLIAPLMELKIRNRVMQ